MFSEYPFGTQLRAVCETFLYMPSGLGTKECASDVAYPSDESINVCEASSILEDSQDYIHVPPVLRDVTAAPTLHKPSKFSLLHRRRGNMALAMEIPRVEKQASALSLLGDRYKVYEKAGSGSAGMVHRAIHIESGRQVALKTPRSTELGAADAAKREYDLLQRLDPHPHIIKAFDFHNLKGEAALVLEFFDGLTLQAAVQEKRLPEPTARALCISLFDAVGHLHAHNVLHRDIKPQNVLVSRCLRKLRLIDFNAAACLEDGVPLTPTGTEIYKAPELLLDELPCERSDVWASGLCIFFMLSGSLPQGRDNLDPFAIVRAEVACRPVSFNEHRWQHVSEECIAMLQSCLALEREARPAMSELLDDAWISDPFMRGLSLLSHVVPGAEAYLSVFSYFSLDAISLQNA